MNLSDLLNNYKVSPRNEIRKIDNILDRRGYIPTGYVSFREYFRSVFLISDYSSYETSFDNFCSNIIFNVDNYRDLSEGEMALSQYCLYCELILNLLKANSDTSIYYAQTFREDVFQLNKLINNGLCLCGYKTIEKKNVIITQKIDIEAEAVAAINKTYQEDIYDYLIAKTIKEKENALTNLSIKLDAMEPNNNYVKQNKKYVQLLRHKEEKDIQEKYSWFFENESYNNNLEKLFRIFLFMISYNDCSIYLNEFEKQLKH